METKFCPKCWRLMYYDPYHDRWYCVACNYESD